MFDVFSSLELTFKDNWGDTTGVKINKTENLEFKTYGKFVHIDNHEIRN